MALTVDDKLLRGADLRCMSVTSAGRSSYDPWQPDGGPTSDEPLAGYFPGFSAAAAFDGHSTASTGASRDYIGPRGVKHANAAPTNASPISYVRHAEHDLPR